MTDRRAHLIRAVVPERVAMLLTGHETQAVFDQHDIVNEREYSTAGPRLGGLLTFYGRAA